MSEIFGPVLWTKRLGPISEKEFQALLAYAARDAATDAALRAAIQPQADEPLSVPAE